MKRFAPFLLAACLALASLSCMAVSRVLFDPTPTPTSTPLPTSTPVPPTLTPSPIPPTITVTPDYCPNGDCISACMKHLPAIAQPGAASKSLKTSYRFAGKRGGILLVTYAVSDNIIKDPFDVPGIPQSLLSYQDDRRSQQKIWNYFAALIPGDQRRFLDEYAIFTDGKDNILASVSQSETDMGKWVLTVDILDAADPQNLTYTLIHEFGHLLTLNSTQVIPSRRVFDNPNSDKIYQEEVDACKAYFVGEGCSLPDSYVNQFVDRYWLDIFAEWQKVDDIKGENDYYAALDAFYQKHKDQFVTDYAPTNPAEDLAESFSFFVLKPKPTGDSIADQKVLFFYRYPELMELRSQIGHRLCEQLNQ